MKRALIVLVAVSLTMAAGSADHATPEGAPLDHPVRHTFSAPVPCGSACPYWIGNEDSACGPEPLALPGSYDEWDFDATPPDTDGSLLFLTYGIRSTIDADVWLCSQVELPGGGWTIDAPNCLIECEPCTAPWIGCTEKGDFPVCLDVAFPPPASFKWQCLPRDHPVRLRVFNWVEAGVAIPGVACWTLRGHRIGQPACPEVTTQG